MRIPGLQHAVVALAITLIPAYARAAPVLATSYDMLNGNVGTYRYLGSDLQRCGMCHVQ